MLLDAEKRYGYGMKPGKNVEHIITVNLNMYAEKFEHTYSRHTCDNPKIGCGEGNRVIVVDGGMKNTR